MEAGGLWVPVAALLGFFVPQVLEHSLARAAARTHSTTLGLAVMGLAIHALFDGAALADPAIQSAGNGSELALAVILHRLPVAITIWALLVPTVGRRFTAIVLTALGVATAMGYAAADTLVAAADLRWLALFQALVAGSLLHVVVHRPAPLTSPTGGTPTGRMAAGVGALLAIVTLATLSHGSEHGVSFGFTSTLLTLCLETAPALLLAFALAGVAQVILPHASLGFLRTGRAPSEALRGMAFGLPLPICSCGVIPLYQTLVSQAVPATAAMAFLVATPELGIDALLISLPLLGSELTLIRVAAATGVAFLIGWGVGRLAPNLSTSAAPVTESESERPRLWQRLRSGLRFGFVEIVDHTGPWLILGIVIASLVEPLLQGDWIYMLPWGADVVLFTFLGLPTYVCASGATPLAAVLIHKGVSPGAAIAFLLAGPATNLTTFGILAKAHGRKVAIIFATAMAAISIVVGLGINMLLGEIGMPTLTALADAHASWLEYSTLAILVLVFALSLLRQGPRGVLGQVFSPYGDDDGCHDHDHDHSHGHDHSHDSQHHDEHEHAR